MRQLLGRLVVKYEGMGWRPMMDGKIMEWGIDMDTSKEVMVFCWRSIKQGQKTSDSVEYSQRRNHSFRLSIMPLYITLIMAFLLFPQPSFPQRNLPIAQNPFLSLPYPYLSTPHRFQAQDFPYFLQLLQIFFMEAHRSEASSPSKFQDHERTITGMTPLTRFTERQTVNHHPTSFHDSTSASLLPYEDLPSRYTYRMHSRILQHTPITQLMRARLRAFVMNQAAKQWIYRETCVLACTLVDLYFQKGGNVEIREFQNLVIACLIIACKLRQNLFPKISYETFKLEELLMLEEKIIKKLNFNLTPTTYYDHAQRIVLLWDGYTQKTKQYNLKLSQQNQGVNYKIRRFFEQLDCVFMVLDSLDLNLEEIVVNLFYLNAREINVYEARDPHLFEEKEFYEFFYPKNDKFLEFYQEFLRGHYKNQPEVNQKVGHYLKPFLAVSPASAKEWKIEGSQAFIEKIREWDQVQTLPKDCYTIVKMIMGKCTPKA